MVQYLSIKNSYFINQVPKVNQVSDGLLIYLYLRESLKAKHTANQFDHLWETMATQLYISKTSFAFTVFVVLMCMGANKVKAQAGRLPDDEGISWSYVRKFYLG